MQASYPTNLILARPLPLLHGGMFSEAVWQAHPLTLLVFYKQSCQTCLFLLPYLNAFYRRLPGRTENLLLVSQDAPAETREFVRRLGLELPVALDYPEYALSRHCNFTAVPALFLIGPSGEILQGSEGFVREEVVAMLDRWKQANRVKAAPLFDDPAAVPAFRPG